MRIGQPPQSLKADPCLASGGQNLLPGRQVDQIAQNQMTSGPAPNALGPSDPPVYGDGTQSRVGPVLQFHPAPSTIRLTIVKFEAEVEDPSLPAEELEIAVFETNATAQMPKQFREFDGDPLKCSTWLHRMHTVPIVLHEQHYELPEDLQHLLGKIREYEWDGKLCTLSQFVATIQDFYWKVNLRSSEHCGVDAVIGKIKEKHCTLGEELSRCLADS